jgi:hypothetical protein
MRKLPERGVVGAKKGDRFKSEISEGEAPPGCKSKLNGTA